MGGIRGAPVWAKIWSRNPALIKGTYEIFRAHNGFLMRVEIETGVPLAPPALPQSPPVAPSLDEDLEGGKESTPSLTTADWDAAGTKSKAHATTASKPAAGASGVSGHQAALSAMDGEVGASSPV